MQQWMATHPEIDGQHQLYLIGERKKRGFKLCKWGRGLWSEGSVRNGWIWQKATVQNLKKKKNLIKINNRIESFTFWVDQCPSALHQIKSCKLNKEERSFAERVISWPLLFQLSILLTIFFLSFMFCSLCSSHSFLPNSKVNLCVHHTIPGGGSPVLLSFPLLPHLSPNKETGLKVFLFTLCSFLRTLRAQPLPDLSQPLLVRDTTLQLWPSWDTNCHSISQQSLLDRWSTITSRAVWSKAYFPPFVLTTSKSLISVKETRTDDLNLVLWSTHEKLEAVRKSQLTDDISSAQATQMVSRKRGCGTN